MKPRFTFQAVLFFVMLFASAHYSKADTFYLDPFGGTAAAGDTFALQTNDKISLRAESGRSYFCNFIPLRIAANSLPTFDVDFNFISEGGTSVHTTSKLFAGYPPVGRFFIPVSTSRYTIAVTQTAGGGEQVKVDCRMTSLFGSYNTISPRFNFLEVTNRLEGSVNAAVTLIRSDGSIPVNGLGLALNGLQRFDLSLHDAVNDQSYGIVIINHDGPVGAVSAQVSQYDIVAGALTKVAVIPLHTRYEQ